MLFSESDSPAELLCEKELLYSAGVVLADPMCGSGTLLIEAAMIICNRAPGLLRRQPWPFEGWHDFDKEACRAAYREARDAAKPWVGAPLQGNDWHPGALELARE